RKDRSGLAHGKQSGGRGADARAREGFTRDPGLYPGRAEAAGLRCIELACTVGGKTDSRPGSLLERRFVHDIARLPPAIGCRASGDIGLRRQMPLVDAPEAQCRGLLRVAVPETDQRERRKAGKRNEHQSKQRATDHRCLFFRPAPALNVPVVVNQPPLSFRPSERSERGPESITLGLWLWIPGSPRSLCSDGAKRRSECGAPE